MKTSALITGIAALFLATGAAAVEQNWEVAIVLKEPGKEPMLYRDMMLTREACLQILSDAGTQMAESEIAPSPTTVEDEMMR